MIADAYNAYDSFDMKRARALIEKRASLQSDKCVVWYLGATDALNSTRHVSPMMWPDSYTPTISITQVAAELNSLVMICIRDLLEAEPEATNFHWIGPHVWPVAYVLHVKGPSDE